MSEITDLRNWLREDAEYAAADVETSTLGLHRPVRRKQLSTLESRELAVARRERALEIREEALRREERSWGSVATLLAVCLLSLLIGATLIWPLVHTANRQGWFGRATVHSSPR